ncbi:uncharacterized protein LOC106637634 isoform X1 [Copidosoma floridanum]|uniref:uncharacterized protein LOC106637634 isoform X1 n=1 Tax=Copidosoma floridanum TaxID=29053 RepID=UPI0006C99388|nr:uncharacterized protein LOC106637634 isoform X1 [Copidosoma floridanum]
MEGGRLGAFILALVLLWCGSEGRPAIDQEPIKFTLGTTAGDKATEKSLRDQVGERVQNGMEWLSRMADAIRFGRGRLVNSVAIARNRLAERVEELTSEARNNVAGAIGAANDIIERSRTNLRSDRGPLATLLGPKPRETVKLESEDEQAFFERKSANPLGALLENVLKPKPIVDGIKEEDKYGNQGDRFAGVGRALVNGFEGLSNLFNAVIELPINAAKKTSRNITEVLNQLGARLVGLQ